MAMKRPRYPSRLRSRIEVVPGIHEFVPGGRRDERKPWCLRYAAPP
ncbi:MAG: hypothetical protein ACLQT5_14940 [Steroidobacteraceae bacterium]